jgi:hypothetical protein
MLRRAFRFWLWTAGINYLAAFAVLAWFIVSGAEIRGNPACRRLDLEIAVYWMCEDPSLWVMFLSNLINVVLTTTLWAPLFVLAAVDIADLRPMALALVGLHAVGFPAALFVVARGVGMARRRMA